MQAEEEDVFTAAPNWFGGNGGLINITAPASLTTCPPHWPDTDPDGKCGPENHYVSLLSPVSYVHANEVLALSQEAMLRQG